MTDINDTTLTKSDLDSTPNFLDMDIGNGQELLELMHCSNCKSLVVPPNVAACTKGHLVCGSCILKFSLEDNNHCQMEIEGRKCGRGINRYKSQIHEYLYYNSYYKCVYAEEGCQKLIMGRNLPLHKLNCVYRPALPCPFTTNCETPVISASRYVTHLVSAHQTLCLESNSSRIQVSYYDRLNKELPGNVSCHRWVCAIFSCFDRKFMLMAEEQMDAIFLWISLIPDKPTSKTDNDDTFQCNLSCLTRATSSGESQDLGVTWGGDVNGTNRYFDEVVTEGDSLFISKQMLRRKYIYKIAEFSYWTVDVSIQQAEIPAQKVETDPGADLHQIKLEHPTIAN